MSCCLGRRKNVFQQIKQNPAHCVKESWLISILKDQYDSFTGNEDTIFLKQRSFKCKWKDLFLFVETNDFAILPIVPSTTLYHYMLCNMYTLIGLVMETTM